MGQVLGHSVDKYVTGKMLQTSGERCWSNLLVERWTHEAGELPPLTPRDTEVAVLLNGHSLVDRIGSGMRQVTHGQPGTVWLCPSGITEEFINVAEPLQNVLHIFLPGRSFEETLLRDLDIDPKWVELRYEAIAQDTFINQIAGQILQELNHESSSGRLLMETLGVALSAYLVHKYSAAEIRQPPARNTDKPLDTRRLARVVEFIRSNLDAELTVTQMASVACMSAAHFARSFRLATGSPPHEFVSLQRLALAKMRLLSEGSQISEIALAAGFSSQANFTRAFRKALGVTPAQFRAQKARPAP
ncbi:AraC family transcriptional regulator [Bradyrhizobium macuxiense]|uniref:AraC family transcriptional regulator n=1 Tax=Bradyrhizobium macuxiense TaxID=1755647 RepID=A0A560LSA4_9BRAD|nr:AraC family transcriptional regulator [Bradyrhizobium macuxiense]TWB98443.1 AraC family transcriptional regulator [Bradyrhizobium macuxiense]